MFNTFVSAPALLFLIQFDYEFEVFRSLLEARRLSKGPVNETDLRTVGTILLFYLPTHQLSHTVPLCAAQRNRMG